MDIPEHKFRIPKTMMIFAVFVIAVLLVSSASTVQAADKDPELEKAAEVGDLKKVTRLLNQGADVNAKNRDGQTALMSAGHVDVTKALLGKGADVNAQDKWGYTVLMSPATLRHVGVVKALVETGADVNAQALGGRTPLRFAALGGDVDVVKALLDQGADVNAKTEDGRTALMFVASWGHVDAKDISDRGANVNAKTKDKTTTMTEYLKDFLDKVATFLAKQKHGRTEKEGSKQDLREMRGPHHYYDYVEVVKLLKAHGAKE